MQSALSVLVHCKLLGGISLYTRRNSVGLKKCEDILLSVEGHATKPKAIIQPVPKQGSSLCARF